MQTLSSLAPNNPAPQPTNKTQDCAQVAANTPNKIPPLPKWTAYANFAVQAVAKLANGYSLTQVIKPFAAIQGGLFLLKNGIEGTRGQAQLYRCQAAQGLPIRAAN